MKTYLNKLLPAVLVGRLAAASRRGPKTALWAPPLPPPDSFIAPAPRQTPGTAMGAPMLPSGDSAAPACWRAVRTLFMRLWPRMTHGHIGHNYPVMTIPVLLMLLLTSTVFAANFSVYEANYPNVKDYNVRVDTADLTIVPRGAFLEMTLELTVSYDFNSWYFKNYDELEFMWEFSLPDQASITGFWLWQEDSLLNATLLDKWTAELLFSEVSSPVRNPALLTRSFADREGQVNYNVRIYPVMRNIKRTFKLEYLLPARPTNETLRVWLPITQLTSRSSPGARTLQLHFMEGHQPDLLGADIENETYNAVTNSWDYVIQLDYDMFVELIYPSPIVDKHYFSTYTKNGDAYYQLAVYPPQQDEVRTPRNYLILVDFNRYNTRGLDGELVLMLLKETMQQAMSAQDSVNIVVAFDDLVWGAADFVACTEKNLDTLFQNVLKRSFPSYSNFQALVTAAAGFLKYKSKPVDVMLFSNTDEISLPDYQADTSREGLAAQIIAMLPKGTTIHVVDLENQSNLVYSSRDNQYVAQLQSFYGFMCNQTGGNLFFLRYHSLKNILSALFYEHITHYQEIEVQTRFASGYAFGKYVIALNQGYYPLHFPIMQIGRFQGSLPLEITVLGKTRLEKFSDQFTITDGDVIPGDEKLALAWHGNRIHELLLERQTNATIMEIMDTSLKQRIVTPYTSFIVQRPDENYGYDPLNIAQGNDKNSNEAGGGDNETPSTGVEAPVENDDALLFDMKAYPNPFNSVVTLRLALPEYSENSAWTLVIYNMLGQKIREFRIDGQGRGMAEIRWDGADGAGAAAGSGVYVAVLQGPGYYRTLKLLLLK